MPDAPRQDSPFDPLWLDSLALASTRAARGPGPRLVDLFLERRLEILVSTTDGLTHVEHWSSEGVAARWCLASRRVLHARTGVSPAVVDTLLSEYGADSAAMTSPRLPSTELDPPRGWRDWALERIARLPGERSSIRFMDRKAVVVRPGVWCVTTTPPLVRVHVEDPGVGSLLAVWDNPLLGTWIRDLCQPPPTRPWRPDSGAHLPVLLTEGSAGVLVHELLGHLVESDLAASGRSPLARLHGVKTTPSSFHLVDDPLRFDLPGAFSHDDEGVVARPRELVRAGTQVGWLCDHDGAGRLSSQAGRGRRSAWTRPPTPRLSNLVLSPGETSPRELERSMGHGLVVTRVAGATVDPHASRIVIRVDRGWEVVRGRRRRPLGPCSVTGGVLEVLGQIDPHLGSDPTPDWRLGWCVKEGEPLPTGSLTPSILVRQLEVL